MAPHKQLSARERTRLVDARLAGMPLKDISNTYDVSYNTVKWTWKQYRKRDQEERDLPRSGRPRKSTTAQDNRLYRRLRIDNDLRWRGIVELSDLGRTQIQQRFLEIDPDFYQYMRHWSPYLTPEHMRQRREYDRQYGRERVEFWANAWFVDECSIEIGVGRPRQWIWRHGGEAWLPRHMAFRSLNKQTLMIWVAMRADGRIVWCFVSDYYESETTMNSRVYARFLRDILS